MKRTSVALPDDLAWILTCEAARSRTSVSEIVRRALTRYFGDAGTSTRPIAVGALGASGVSDTSERIEAIVAEEWSRAHGREWPG